MTSKLGTSSQQLIRAIDVARAGATVAYIHDGDTEYFRRLCRHLCWIRRVSCYVSYNMPYGFEIHGEGEIWFRKADPAELADLRSRIRGQIVVDHRIAERAKKAA